MGQVCSVDAYLADGCRPNTYKDTGQARLSCGTWSDDTQYLAGPHGERNPMQNGVLSAGRTSNDILDGDIARWWWQPHFLRFFGDQRKQGSNSVVGGTRRDEAFP